MSYPAPPIPADCDLQDFPFMPLQVARLRDSDLAAECSAEACWYAVLLWAASWHQLPAASLPDNDAVLTKLIGLGRDVKTFRKHKAQAMRGFVLCSDGRLYHPVVAAQAAESWSRKLRQRWHTECARIKKANQRGGTLRAPSFEEFVTATAPASAFLVLQMSPGTSEIVPGDNDKCPPGNDIQGTGTGIIDSPTLTPPEPERENFAERSAEATAAAGDALASLATCPGIATLAPLRALLVGETPCDWREDVLPAIASAAAWHRSRDGPGSMRSWTTACRIAVENRDRRLSGAPALKVVSSDAQRSHPAPSAKRQAHERNMAAALAGAQSAAARRGG